MSVASVLASLKASVASMTPEQADMLVGVAKETALERAQASVLVHRTLPRADWGPVSTATAEIVRDVDPNVVATVRVVVLDIVSIAFAAAGRRRPPAGAVATVMAPWLAAGLPDPRKRVAA